LIEQINKIPQKFYKYIKKTQLYDLNVKLKNKTKSKHKFNIQNLEPNKSLLSANVPTVIPTVITTPSKLIENPFNRILFNPIKSNNKLNNVFDKESSVKSTFYPINTRY
jgi:hypothetical protein